MPETLPSKFIDIRGGYWMKPKDGILMPVDGEIPILNHKQGIVSDRYALTEDNQLYDLNLRKIVNIGFPLKQIEGCRPNSQFIWKNIMILSQGGILQNMSDDLQTIANQVAYIIRCCSEYGVTIITYGEEIVEYRRYNGDHPWRIVNSWKATFSPQDITIHQDQLFLIHGDVYTTRCNRWSDTTPPNLVDVMEVGARILMLDNIGQVFVNKGKKYEENDNDLIRDLNEFSQWIRFIRLGKYIGLVNNKGKTYLIDKSFKIKTTNIPSEIFATAPTRSKNARSTA